MKHSALQGAEKYMKAHIRKKRWYRVVTCLACVVVFCTTYALILPAITLENTGCEIPEHTHVQECYAQVTSVSHTEPVCTIEGLNIHQHDNTCYDSEGNLICRYANFVVHRHDSACFDKDGNLWCALPEIEVHQHTDSCYTQPEVHEHTADCFTLEQWEMTCVEHMHTENCYVQSQYLTCGREESEGHQHNETCMVERSEIQCGQEESAGHQHSESCMGENGEIQCGIAESRGHFHTESCMGIILEAQCGIAESEGHHHDDSCYETTQELVCEIESDHQHTDACYAWEQVLICDISTQLEASTEPVLTCREPEVILHKHTADCSDGNGYLICGMPQVLEHRHTDTCFETVQEAADTESLTCTLPEDETHTHTALCYGTWNLTCTLPEHTHTEECYASEEETGDYAVMLLDDGDSDEGIMPQTDSTETLTITSITGSGTKYDANGDYYTSDLRIEFTLTTSQIKTDAAYIYTYPEGVVVPTGLLNDQKDLLDSSGGKAGTYEFIDNGDGTYSVQIRFDESYVKSAGETITGYVQFKGELHAEEVQDGGSIWLVGHDNIGLIIPSDEIEYPANETNYYDIDVSKEGSYVQDGDKLVYTVYVRTSKGTPDPILFTDTITADGLTLGEPTVTVEKGCRYWYNENTYYDDPTWTKQNVAPSYSNGTISMSLDKLNVAETKDPNNTDCIKQDVYKITYTYDITGMDVSSVTPQNTVTVTATDTTKNQTITDTATVDVNVYKDQTRTLDKTGEYVPEDGKIKWTITVNANNKDLTGFTLTDEMLGDISQGTEISIQPNTGFEWVYATGTDENGDIPTTSTVTGLTFTAMEGAQTNNNQYTITYYTNAPSDTSTKTPVTNTVELETPGGEKTEKNVTVTVGGYTLDKNGWYNASNGKIEWTITLNQNRSDIAGATLEDAMFKGLTNTDFTIEPSEGFNWITVEDGTITGIRFNAGENDTNTNSYTIRYSTEVESSGEAQTVSNTAIFNPNPGGVGGEVIGTGEVTVGGYTIEKSGSADYWNYNGTVTWTIRINSNRLDITNATLTDEMFAALKTGDFTVSPDSGFEWIYAVDGDGNKTDTITGMKFTAAEGEKNTNYYSISYTTSNPSSWSDQTIQNTAFFTPDGKDPIPDDAKVTIPGKGSVSKSMDGAMISEDGSTAVITWTVTLDIPAGGLPAGTVIEDNVTQRDQWTVNTNQWMTRVQITAWATNMTWNNGAGATNVYTPSPMNVTFLASDGNTYNYSDISNNLNGYFDSLTYTVFRITFADGLIPPEGATKLSFTYCTTADLSSGQIGKNEYYNSVTVDGKSSNAAYTYYKPGVVKMNGSFQTGTTYTESEDGVLTWVVKVTLGSEESKSLTVTDTLPNYVVLDKLELRDANWNTKELTIGETRTYEWGTIGAYRVNVTQSGSNVVAVMTPATEDGFLPKNTELNFIYTCHVDKDSLADLETGKTYEFINKVTAKTDECSIGSSEQTQNWTYSTATSSSQYVDKTGSWDNDNRRVNYSVVLNPEGKDLLPDEEILTMTDTLTYTNSVDAWTETGGFQQKRFNIEVTLIQNSVRLFRRNEDGSKGQEITDWTWLYSVSSAQYNPNSITNTITATGIPDSTPLILEYAYTVYSDIEKGWVINDLGISNTAKLEGVNNAQDSESSTKVWKDSSSSAGVTTDKTFTLYKVEEGNYNNGLSGAVFAVYAYDTETDAYNDSEVKTYTTDSNGMFQIKWSDGGYAYNTLYKVVEITPPTGYRLPDTVEEYYFYFSSETDTEHTLPENLPGVAVDLSKTDKTVYAENVNNMTKITVNKQWFSADGSEIIGTKAGSVSFDLYQVASATPPGESGGSDSGGSSGGTGVSYRYTSNYYDEVASGTLSGFQIGSVVEVTVTMKTPSQWWKPPVTLTGLSGTGYWDDDGAIYTCQATITAESIVVDVSDSKGKFSVMITKISDPESGNTGSGDEEETGGDTSTTPSGTLYGTYTVSNTDGWTWTKGDLPLTGTDADGNTVYYTYYVVEHGVTNCTTAYENNGGIASGTIVIKNTESENPAYTLPETGGAGTTPYTMGGLLLMAAAGFFLLYNHSKRRREDASPS
ncbi:MAG: LPXTG cell wall anchor domain-containing protein [Oscillospiraceae bacterium]|nr:LPXTG cell wall anchor domain-containing protein [Oscillospiraceae bacterium]